MVTTQRALAFLPHIEDVSASRDIKDDKLGKIKSSDIYITSLSMCALGNTQHS
jgi:hypothetical protein